jgi:hypothetical protein
MSVAVVIVVLWLLTGCKTVERPAVAIAGAAVSASNVMATADVEVQKLSPVVRETLTAFAGAAVALSNEVAQTGPELRTTLQQIRYTAAAATNVTQAVAARVEVSTEHSSWLWSKVKELWPYVAAALIAWLAPSPVKKLREKFNKPKEK